LLPVTPVFSAEKFISIGSDALPTITKKLASKFQVIHQDEDISLLKVSDNDIVKISEIMHNEFNRCGGFMSFENESEGLKQVQEKHLWDFAQKSSFADYTIAQQDRVENLIGQVDASKILSVIQGLSQFKNRYYRAPTGVESQKYLKDTWSQIVANRSDAKVEYFSHSSWPQPSVVLTITGSETPDEIIVVGGHADSISGYWDRNNSRAPGSDDNASGIATLTEALRVLVKNSYQPKKTVKFMGYAAEEVGLLGSKEIASSFRQEGKQVVGVLQLDMTNFHGSDIDLVLMSDFTNSDQNAFIGKLVDEYLKLPWGYDKCGYACSDHASWHTQGYPSSIPFEARMREMNHKIHTPEDTLDVSNGNADHAAKFSKLALAYIVELDK